MKPKVNIPNRGRSNPPKFFDQLSKKCLTCIYQNRKNNNPPSSVLEEETKAMVQCFDFCRVFHGSISHYKEAKLKDLKELMAIEQAKREAQRETLGYWINKFSLIEYC